jgi:D-alanyl-D-alanine carboxypeptidase
MAKSYARRLLVNTAKAAAKGIFWRLPKAALRVAYKHPNSVFIGLPAAVFTCYTLANKDLTLPRPWPQHHEQTQDTSQQQSVNPKSEKVIVFDKASRRFSTLHQTGAKGDVFIASISKLMVMKLAFEAMNTGKLTLDTPVTVSARAAGVAPTKAGLAAGEKKSFGDLLALVYVHSANDAAIAVAEAVDGNVDKFIVNMNRRAGEMGLSSMRFFSATGLPRTVEGRRRENSAAPEDIVRLYQKLVDEHPAIFDKFEGKRSVTVSGHPQAYGSHTRLVFCGQNDGLSAKTGTTRGSRSSIVARYDDDKKVIYAFLTGFVTAEARDKRAIDLLKEYGPKAGVDMSGIEFTSTSARLNCRAFDVYANN